MATLVLDTESIATQGESRPRRRQSKRQLREREIVKGMYNDGLTDRVDYIRCDGYIRSDDRSRPTSQGRQKPAVTTRRRFIVAESASLPDNDPIAVRLFLDRVYSLCRIESTEEDAIDLVYEHFASLLASDEVDECDAILGAADEYRITPAVHASILTITAGARAILSERYDFYERVHARLSAERGESAAGRVLVGLA